MLLSILKIEEKKVFSELKVLVFCFPLGLRRFTESGLPYKIGFGMYAKYVVLPAL